MNVDKTHPLWKDVVCTPSVRSGLDGGVVLDVLVTTRVVVALDADDIKDFGGTEYVPAASLAKIGVLDAMCDIARVAELKMRRAYRNVNFAEADRLLDIAEPEVLPEIEHPVLQPSARVLLFSIMFALAVILVHFARVA